MPNRSDEIDPAFRVSFGYPSLMELAARPKVEGLAKQVLELQLKHDALVALTGQIIATLALPANQPQFERVDPYFLQIIKRWEQQYQRLTTETPDRTVYKYLTTEPA